MYSDIGSNFPVTITESFPPIKSVTRSDFLSGISKQLTGFLKLLPFMDSEGADRSAYSKRFYDYVAHQAEFAELILDSCGAKENRAWFFLRELVASVRSFGKVSAVLRYLELRIATYNIPDQDVLEFQVITGNVRQIFDGMLQKIFEKIDQEVKNLNIEIPQQGVTREDFPYFSTPGKLYADMWIENSHEEEAAIVKIATSYLEIAEEYNALGFCRIFPKEELVNLVPEHVNEERLRTFEAAVHNLQAVYDTYIQYTRLEAKDPRLPRLRGCVSIALHLLEIATILVHFHERHERNARYPKIYQQLQMIMGNSYQILDILGNYALFYCTRFLQKGKQLSEETVMDYAQITSKRIAIPMYRGFHVRPSTYIAKIARRYGSEVQMHLGDEIYDASCVFDLFRANEKINMEKRRLIAKELLRAQHLTPTPVSAINQILRRELKYLAEEKVLVIHQEISNEDIIISDLGDKEDLSPEELRGIINELISRLLALGKIDIIMPVSVTFIGGKQALHDIDILAKSGYGEDAKGNNIPLPEEISYLYK